MKKKANIVWLIPLLAIVLVNFQCRKNKTDTPEKTELEKLPPITQTGAKTFGCLVNGVAFIPDNGCSYLCTPAFKPRYDNLSGGLFTISSVLTTIGYDKSINIGIDSCTSIGVYYFDIYNIHKRFGYNDYKNSANCITLFNLDLGISLTGFLEITKFNLYDNIISGKFEFNIHKTGCELIKITNGRFDAKL
jgi:hypothetical protein